MRSIEPGDPMWPYVMLEHARMMAARARVLMPEWPVFAPVEQGAGLALSEYGQSNGDTTFIEIAVTGGTGGPKMSVRSQLAGGEAIPSLDAVLAQWSDRSAARSSAAETVSPSGVESGLPAAPNAERGWVWIDGARRRALRQQAGPFTAWQLLIEQVAVTVAMRDGAAQHLGLVRMRDLADLVERGARHFHATHRPDWRNPRAWAVPPDQSAPLWAHRGVVALTLAARQRDAADANRPLRRLDQDWSLWWEAARDEQMNHTGQTRWAAMEAVGAMVNQLGDLSRSASWWADEIKRRQAIEQVIRFTVYGDTVPSVAAQQLWPKMQPPGPSAPGQDSEMNPDQFRTWAEKSDELRREWVVAWQEWADQSHNADGQ